MNSNEVLETKMFRNDKDRLTRSSSSVTQELRKTHDSTLILTSHLRKVCALISDLGVLSGNEKGLMNSWFPDSNDGKESEMDKRFDDAKKKGRGDGDVLGGILVITSHHDASMEATFVVQ